MTMAERLMVHKEIEQSNEARFDGWNRALADAIYLTLDMYRAGEIGLSELDKVATEIYEELLN